MNKDLYEKIAEVIHLSTDSGMKHLVNKSQLVGQLIVLLKKDNEEFDGYKFYDDCYNKKNHVKQAK